MSEITPRELLLDAAAILVKQDRNKDYGDPKDNFGATAALWSAYKGVEFSAHDVAVFMILLKTARLQTSPGKEDNWLDIAGYAALGFEVRPY